MIKLFPILNELLSSNIDKNIINSNPKGESKEKFIKITERIFNVLSNPQKFDKEQLFNTDENSNIFKPSMISNVTLTQYIGEYNGDNLKQFTKKLAKIYEKQGFITEFGYGSDDIKGFEVKHDNEVIGEVDIIEKGTLSKYNNLIVIKLKK